MHLHTRCLPADLPLPVQIGAAALIPCCSRACMAYGSGRTVINEEYFLPNVLRKQREKLGQLALTGEAADAPGLAT